MSFKENSEKACVKFFFDTPITNESSLKCYGDVDNADYSGFDTHLNKYLNEKAISEMIKINSEVTKILNKFKIAVKVNMGILADLVKNHLPQTKEVAIGVADHLPQDFQPEINRKALAEATGLHDVAKVLIPEDILNKKGSLNHKERKIMEEHASLSYEMLKTTDLDKDTLHLIKHHHNVSIQDINLQILLIADCYSALREKRSYKEAMSKEQALDIIKEDTKKGKYHPYVYKALVNYANAKEQLAKFNSQRQAFNLKSANSFSA
ncbi:MAG: HD domain-containing protein [Candidatus Gastranaerophilales bacterium]|nr:HD domain-containing protein [Candidatus Gastranaerophilales bacterium]